MGGKNIPRKTSTSAYNVGVDAIVSSAKSQADKFKQAARELECDENAAHFDERLKKIAQAKPKDGSPAPKAKKAKNPDAN